MPWNEWTSRARAGGLAAAVVLGGLLLWGCPRTGVVCGAGQTACGNTCVDLTSDAKSCGHCGATCGSGGVCQASACVAQSGALSCGTRFVDPQTDPANCGGCGKACESWQVCEAGQCQVACTTPGFTRCGSSCVDLMHYAGSCGACGNVCPDTQSCHEGVCAYDVVAACFNSGQVVGIQAGTDYKGPLTQSGSAPQTLAPVSDVLLAGDSFDQRIYQAHLGSLDLLDVSAPVGSDVRHIVVADPYLYEVEDGTHTLRVLHREGASPDGGFAEGRVDGGFDYATVAQLGLGQDTYPQAIAQLGSTLYIPLYGGFGSAASAGQKVAVVDVSDPANPTRGQDIDLSTLDLQPFDSGGSIARPAWIVARNGRLYVPLNNLRADYSPGGPGLLARLDPATRQVSTLNLGSGCLNAGFAAPMGTSQGTFLVVSCGGQTDYSASPAVTTQTGLVLLDQNDQPVSTASLECPAGQTGCVSASAFHLAVVGTRIYVGDASQGRVFVFERSSSQLVERRGFNGAADGGQPLDVCPPGPYGSLVSDVLAVP